ncbi:MAG TPA: M14 family metallopeptidase, partial [Actinomycetota bacterium]|nr:M14 family metallopeptidase [Actinomycetota bacterium]
MTKRSLFVLALVAVLLSAFVPVGRTDSARPMLVRVHPSNALEAEFLMSHFDETHNHGRGQIELLLWPGDAAELDALDIDYEVVVEDLFAHDLAQGGTAAAEVQVLPGPDRDDYRRLVDYNAEMADLEKKNPDLVKLFQFPQPTLEGRPVFGVEIAADVKAVDDGRPIFYIDGVHHAREWPASEYTMLFVHHLVEKFGKDPKITSLLKKARVIAVPIVNVDGFDYSRESVTSVNQPARDYTDNLGAGNGFEGYWRKNRRSLTGATAPGLQRNPDAFGVDPNRNYSYLWGDSNGGSSSLQLDATYRGEAPFSEPETQNVRDLILSRPVTGVITNHTYQASVLRAGGGKAPEDAILAAIGDKMAKILGYTNAPTVGYPTTGTTDDWSYAAMGALGFTIEHGRLGFHPAYDLEVGKFWKQHMDAFMVMFGVSASPRYHSVIEGKVAGGPAELTITKTFDTELSPGNPTGEESVVEKIKMTLTT